MTLLGIRYEFILVVQSKFFGDTSQWSRGIEFNSTDRDGDPRSAVDVHRRGGVRLEDAIPHAQEKFRVREVDLSHCALEQLQARREEFELDGSRGVDRLVPSDQRLNFVTGWGSTVQTITCLVEANQGNTS